MALGKGLKGVEVGGKIKVLVCLNINQKLELMHFFVGFFKKICQAYISTHCLFNLIRL